MIVLTWPLVIMLWGIWCEHGINDTHRKQNMFLYIPKDTTSEQSGTGPIWVAHLCQLSGGVACWVCYCFIKTAASFLNHRRFMLYHASLLILRKRTWDTSMTDWWVRRTSQWVSVSRWAMTWFLLETGTKYCNVMDSWQWGCNVLSNVCVSPASLFMWNVWTSRNIVQFCISNNLNANK